MFAIVLASCSRQVKVHGSWEKGVSHDESFTRVLIVALSPNSSARCNFELFLETQIRATGADATASCNLMNTSENLTAENIHAVVLEYGADAVLTTILVQSDGSVIEGGDRDTRGGLYLKAIGSGYEDFYFGGYGVYGVPVVYGEFMEVPVITSIEGEVQIQSMLYATQNKTLVYKLITTAHDLYSSDNAFAEITPRIAKRLQDEGLLPD
ncbi:MAG: hypothetical protein GY746_13590 [Gammaproteobacteria bacterium]|nr:hypothetical protein [Gammaproteobacteria bacterium]MCP4277230.1 hypothetical protein [Gammaproteobacteria bacterium]MCP4832852.1 hypothetical protein [Gammaproteobacteria bacterium]